MDAKELYGYLMRSYFKSMDYVPWEKICKGFALELIESNDTPDSCKSCVFEKVSGECHLIKDRSYLKQRKPICTTYDFIKYILENI